MRTGDIAQIDFWDHCENGHPILCRVYGEITQINRLHIEVVSWKTLADPNDTSNQTRFSIVRKAINGKPLILRSR